MVSRLLNPHFGHVRIDSRAVASMVGSVVNGGRITGVGGGFDVVRQLLRRHHRRLQILLVLAVLVQHRLHAHEVLAEPIGFAQRLLVVVGNRRKKGRDFDFVEAAEGGSKALLSQVERGETSPTLAVAGRIATGLDLSLSQLLRLDEEAQVSVVRRTPSRPSWPTA